MEMIGKKDMQMLPLKMLLRHVIQEDVTVSDRRTVQRSAPLYHLLRQAAKAERESLAVRLCLWSKFAGIRPSDAAKHRLNECVWILEALT